MDACQGGCCQDKLPICCEGSTPIPASIAQADPQYLLYQSNSTYVDSYYHTDVARVKYRSPTSNILSHSDVPSTYTRDNTATKAGSTVTLGPFHSVPPTLGEGKLAAQDPFELSHDLGRTMDRQTTCVLHKEFERAASVLRDEPQPLAKLFEPYRVAKSDA